MLNLDDRLQAFLDVQETSSSVVAIDPMGLLLAAGFVVLVAWLSHVLKLDLIRSLLVAAARCYAQLVLLGWVLVYLFAWDHPAVTGAVFGVMILFSAYTIHTRLSDLSVTVFTPVLTAVAIGGLAITAIVLVLILRVDPFWNVQYWLPIGGMVLGNSMNGIALSVERFFADLKTRRPQIETWTALGATTKEACAGSVRVALRAGLIPTINNMATVGVVSIPGMMTGQVLAGSDPGLAARYQIVVMLMISAATALASVLAVLGCARRAFDSEGNLCDSL